MSENVRCHEEQGRDAAILLVGYGNLSRRDDGVAFHIIQRLMPELGLPPCDLVAEDEEDVGGCLSVMRMHQLTPEMAETLVAYDVVIFVDAHVAASGWEPVHWQEIAPGYRSGMVSHHLKPQSVLALCRTLFGQCPEGYILSVLGTDFDFGEDLSKETSDLADQAVQKLASFIHSCSAISKRAPTENRPEAGCGERSG